MNVIVSRYKKLGEDFEPQEVTMRKALRINKIKAPKNILERLQNKNITLEKIPYLRNAYWYEADFSLASTEEHLLGYIYIQETASQLPPVLLLDAITPKRILDMCAAPGSKTTQLADLTNNQIPIDALDIDQQRLRTLKDACERLGVTSVTSFKLEGQYVKDLKTTYDAILLDAPCSGNFCVEPDFFEKRNPQDFAERGKLQKKLLERAVQILEPGGVLCYSTCSLEPEENEFVVSWALEHLTVSLIPVSLPIGDAGYSSAFGKKLSKELEKTKRFWPHKVATEGFFIALFKKDL